MIYGFRVVASISEPQFSSSGKWGQPNVIVGIDYGNTDEILGHIAGTQ